MEAPLIPVSVMAQVLSTNIAQPFTMPSRTPYQTGIHKVGVDSLDVFNPGPSYGDGSGVAGDFVGDSKHHGGAEKAVYFYAREELDYWGKQAGTSYPNGMFGENVTTTGINWAKVLVNQRFSVGSAVLEVSSPRQPCRTFATWLGIKGWVKTFAQRGDCGAYARVIEPGTIKPGDCIAFHQGPEHGITMGMAFAALMGDLEIAKAVLEAQCLSPHYHDALVKRLSR